MSMNDVFCPLDEWGDTKTLCTKHGIWATIDFPCHRCENGEEADDDNGLQLQIFGSRSVNDNS